MLRHLPDYLALAEQQAAALAARDAVVSLARLAGAVHHAAHHRHGDVPVQPAQPLFHLVREGNEVYLRPPAGRAGHEAHAALFEARRLEYLHARAHFLHRVGRQRDPYRVAYALHQQRAYAHRRLDDPAVGRARLRHAQMQRIGQLPRRKPVRLHGQRHRGRLHRQCDIVEPAIVQQPDMPLRRLQHRLSRRLAILLQERLFQTAAIDAYPYRNVM